MATIPLLAVSCKYEELNKNEQTQTLIWENKIKNKEVLPNILEIQDAADVNFYYSSWGIQPFYNLIRLAMLSKQNVKFYVDGDREFQNSLNEGKFLDFLNNKRKTNKITQNTIDILKGSSEYDYYEIADKYAKENKDKKINVFLNSDHITNHIWSKYYNSLTKLSKNNNVNLIAIEDSDLLGDFLYDSFWNTKEFKDLWFNKENNEWMIPANGRVSRQNQYLLANTIDNLKLFFSSGILSTKLINLGFKNIYSFFNDENKTLKDIIFSERDNQKDKPKRLFSYWPEIIGLDWKKEKSIVDKVKQTENKPTLIVLGTSRAKNDINNLDIIVEKYSETYSIFYKGHPGSNYISRNIELRFRDDKKI
ncbi:hypothetical protein N8G13_00880 [Mycoplasma zalophi]|uniref:hypothetical protein n=1 Tax=Mycoplasma zalophi TaxID=191287 RepID=UPI0021C58115|nr:hypothetical protein [Mycoplasma zalophi]MCU4117018.1 hypothetical protein [Mycoplasma zalophi]